MNKESSYISNFNKFNSDIYSLHPLKLGDILNNDKNESSEESSKIIFGVYGHILSLNIDGIFFFFLDNKKI